MSQWEAAATKGRLAVEVHTVRRWLQAAASVITMRGARCQFILKVFPDGDDDGFVLLVPDAEAVRGFLKNMEPHTVSFHVQEDESVESVKAAIHQEIH